MNKIKWIILFIFFAARVLGQSNLTGYEYWFNDDYANLQSVAIDPATNHQFTDDIDVGHLPDGLNRFTLRYKDENGFYSSTYTNVFLKHTLEKLKDYEYWFNSDYVNKQVVSLTPNSQHQISGYIDISHLPGGVNVFHIRYKGNNGLYSSTYTNVFLKHTLEKLKDYEYWFNSDYVNKQVVSLTPNSQHQISGYIDISHLPGGVNVFHIRYKGNNGLYSSTQSKVFLNLPVNEQLTHYEYWMNNNFEDKISVAITPANQHELNSEIDVSELVEGLNFINIRYKANTGIYSSTLNKFFYKNNGSIHEGKKVISWDYWFNNDYSNRIETAITPTANQQFTSIIDATALSEGLNVFNIRFKDENGIYSTTLSEYFYRSPLTSVTDNRVVAYEYWFNNGYENRVETAFTPANRQDLITSIDPAALSEGLNVFNIRFKDENGIYSSTLTEVFYKNPHTGINSNKLYAYKYRIENANGVAQGGDPFTGYTAVSLHEPINPALIDLDIDMSQIPKGSYSFIFAALDSLGLWSVTTTDVFEKTAFPVAQFTFDNNLVCSNVPIQFINQSIDADTCFWDFGDGHTSREWEPEHIFASAGQYEVFLTATDSVSGRDSTISQLIEVLPSAFSEETLEICQGDTLHWNGFEYFETGDYDVVLTAANGCDSTVTLHLTVNPTFTNITASCSNLKRTENAYPETSDISANVQNEYGTNYSVADWNGLLAIADIDNWISCMGLQNFDCFFLTVNGQRFNGSRHYFVQYFPDGVPGYFSVHDQIANKLFLGSWYGIEMSILARNNEPIPTTSICSTELPFVFGNQNLTESGQYTETFQTIHGCDSIVTINLEVKQAYDLHETLDLCQSELPYTFGTQTLTETGVYTESWPLPNGCDSTITLNFIVHPEYDIEARKAICIDSTYQFGMQLISEAGIYEELFQSEFGCDSLVTLTVQAVPGNIGVFDTTFVSPADECFNGFYTITVAGDGYPVTIEPGAFTNYIAGQSIHFKHGFHARSGSYINAYISTEPWYCDHASQAIVLANPAPDSFADKSFEISDNVFENESLLEQSMKVYPNPNNGIFTLQFANIENNTRVIIFNTLGQKVYETTVNGETHQVELPNIQRGIYLVKAINDKEQFDRKVLVQ